MPKKITLTFDNGPDPECTPMVLEVLKARNVKATFFVCGQGNSLHPALKARGEVGKSLLSQIHEQGHWIGNHSLTHTVELGTTNDPEVIAREIGGNQDILAQFNTQRLFRPYMGGGEVCKRTFSPPSIRYLRENQYTVVMFNCVPRDWENPDTWPEEAFKAIDQLDWTLLIVHDVKRYGGMAHLARFLDEALQRGIEFVQEFPADCVPIRNGHIVGSLDGMVCGDVPEEATPLSRAAADMLE